MIQAIVAGFVYRIFRISLEASPYILIGLACSGWARAALGPARLRALFGEGRWSGPMRAWCVATSLPVCALGVLPVLRELRRSGVRRDAVLTFALAAPVFNPVTILSATAHLGPGPTAALLAASGLAAVAAGIAAGRSSRDRHEAMDDGGPLPGRGRVAAAVAHALREASGPVWPDIVAGVVAAAVVSALVSPAWLADGTFSGDPLATLRMATVAAPAYVSPEVGVTALPEMVKFRQSAGAMLILMVLGVGFGAGHLTWAARSYGPAVVARWVLGLMIASSVGAGAVELIQRPVGVANPDNDHYDSLVSPVAAGQVSSPLRVIHETLDRVGAAGVLPPIALALMAAAGLGLRSGRLGARLNIERWISREPAEGAVETSNGAGTNAFNRPLPRWIVRAAGTLGVALLMLMGAVVAFPSPDESFRDMSVIKADFFGEIGAADVAAPLHHLALWERCVSRLPIGAGIRFQFPGADARRLSSELEDRLRGLRAATSSHDAAKARALFQELQPVYERCRRAYRVD